MSSNYFSSSETPAFDRLRLTAARRVQPSRRSFTQRVPQLKKVVFCIILVFLCFVGGPWDAIATFAYWDAVAVQNPNTANAWEQQQQHEKCAFKMDKLDDTFNERRKVRQNAASSWKPSNIKEIFDLYEPEANCISEERLGSDSKVRYEAFGDGPKFVCGVDVIAQKPDCLVYSVGSNNDIRFEKAVHTHTNYTWNYTLGGVPGFIIENSPACEIHTFDPTLDSPFVGDEYATFHPWGLGTDRGREGASMSGRKNDIGERMSFQTIIEKLGHTNRTIDLLKIDCEGCEYASMPPLFDLIASGDVQVDQILIELHSTKSNFTSHLKAFFEAADKAKMRIVHLRWGCEGFRCVEYALVSEWFLRKANADIICS